MKKYLEVYQLIVNEIQTGVRKAGDRLPSIRQMSTMLGVSKNTVIIAYQLLLEERWVITKFKSGYYIIGKQYDDRFQNITSEFVNAYNGIGLLGQQLTHTYQHKPGDGRYAQDFMKSLCLHRYLPHLNGESLLACLEYGDPAGYIPLRSNVVSLLKARELNINKDNLLMSAGTNHSLDLIIRHFLNKGDSVLVESPGYYPLFSKLDFAGIKRLSIERRYYGYDLHDLEMIFEKRSPKIFFLQPYAHNPTGTDLPQEHLKKISMLCKKYKVLIVEDDPFLLTRKGEASYFYHSGAPTIYLSSFSKTLTASFRCGFIVASSAIIQSLTKLKLITIINTSSINEAIINDLIQNGTLFEHINLLKKQFSEKASSMLNALATIPNITPYPHNPGGLYTWFHITTDDKKLAAIARDNDIFLAPGSLFFSGKISYSALRINKFFLDEMSLKFLQTYINK